MKILLVEDDPLFAETVRIALESLGHEVVYAQNGHLAWKIFKENPFKIVVSDWVMPGLDGLSLCKKIRQFASPHYTYFIMLTGQNDKAHFDEAMEGGVDDFLLKPLNQSALSIRMRVAKRIMNFRAQYDLLRKMLPLCSYCGKIKSDDGSWQEVEQFIEKNTERDVSHSICPSCFESHVEPQFKD